MAAPTSSIITRVAYGVSQLPRVAWYLGHGLALRRLAEAARRSNGAKARRRARTKAPVPDRLRLYADMARLFLQDLANVEAGVYPLPADHDGSLLTLINRSRLFFEDLPEIHRRRERCAYNEVLNQQTRGKRPRYYLQNFHFQSGGWMTDDSAERYDTQVEVLLNGTANAIRRQALPPLSEVFAGRDQRKLRLLDIGCGTGRFLDFVILFHELPPRIRRIAIRECARVLKPGGRLVILDSLQRGDRSGYGGLLELFPQNYHEPYYSSYTNEDFSVLAADCDLKPVRNVNAFISKMMVFDKVLPRSASRPLY